MLNQFTVNGNFLDWYIEDVDGLEQSCPLQFINCEMLHIDEECVVFQISKFSTIILQDVVLVENGKEILS